MNKDIPSLQERHAAFFLDEATRAPQEINYFLFHEPVPFKTEEFRFPFDAQVIGSKTMARNYLDASYRGLANELMLKEKARCIVHSVEFIVDEASPTGRARAIKVTYAALPKRIEKALSEHAERTYRNEEVMAKAIQLLQSRRHNP